MTLEQRKTAKRLATLGMGLLVLIGYALWIEFEGLAQGGASAISTLAQLGWAHQPWVFWLLSVLVAFVMGFLGGHFFGQNKEVYEGLRKREKGKSHVKTGIE